MRSVSQNQKFCAIIVQLIPCSFLTATSLSGCSSHAPRINPGSLEVSEQVSTHSAQITNIIQLSKKEAPASKVILGGIVGAVVGSTIGRKASDKEVVGVVAGDIGANIGVDAVTKRYGKTIYRLTLKLSDGSIKHIHVRGGQYHINEMARITVNKQTGNITSLVVSSV